METKTFKLPTNPFTKKEQKIVVERPSPDSVWYLVIEPDKAVPLMSLKNPKNPQQVLEALEELQGMSGVAQFMIGGYSKI